MVQLSAQTIPPATKEEEGKLIAVLKSDAPQKEKADACRNLAVIGTKDAVPALAALLGDEKLAHMARYGLEPIPDPAVDDALRAALGNVKGGPLVGVLGSIGVRRDAKAVPAVVGMLQDADAEVARAAAKALGKIGSPEAAKALTDRLAGVPANVRSAVADGCLA
jgi:HEAT repeat protein